MKQDIQPPFPSPYFQGAGNIENQFWTSPRVQAIYIAGWHGRVRNDPPFLHTSTRNLRLQ